MYAHGVGIFCVLFAVFQVRTVFVYLVCSVVHLLMFFVYLQMFVDVRLPVQGCPVVGRLL